MEYPNPGVKIPSSACRALFGRKKNAGFSPRSHSLLLQGGGPIHNHGNRLGQTAFDVLIEEESLAVGGGIVTIADEAVRYAGPEQHLGLAGLESRAGLQCAVLLLPDGSSRRSRHGD